MNLKSLLAPAALAALPFILPALPVIGPALAGAGLLGSAGTAGAEAAAAAGAAGAGATGTAAAGSTLAGLGAALQASAPTVAKNVGLAALPQLLGGIVGGAAMPTHGPVAGPGPGVGHPAQPFNLGQGPLPGQVPLGLLPQILAMQGRGR